MQKQFQVVKMDVKNGRFLSPGFELSWKPKIDKYCLFCGYLYVLIGWRDGHGLLFFFSLTVNEIVRFIFEESSASFFLWEQRRMKFEKSSAFVSLRSIICKSTAFTAVIMSQFEAAILRRLFRVIPRNLSPTATSALNDKSNGICVETSPDLAHD